MNPLQLQHPDLATRPMHPELPKTHLQTLADLAACAGLSVMRTFAFMALIFATFTASALSNGLANGLGQGPSPLPVEEAFASSISITDAKTLQVRFDIADEYYLYRDKLKFSLIDASDNTSTISLGKALLPEAIAYDDEFFGTTYIYRHAAVVDVPMQRSKFDSRDVLLRMQYQGCADMGICYPPTTKDFPLQLPALQGLSSSVDSIAASPATPMSGTRSTGLGDLFGQAGFGSDSEPVLSPQEAFLPSISIAQDSQLDMQWFVEPGYYLYRDKMAFSLVNAGGATIIKTELDAGVMQHDEFFGDVAVLRDTANARLQLDSTPTGGDTVLQVHYQGCADIGICFPPQVVELPANFISTSVAAVASATGAGTTDGTAAITNIANSSVDNAANAATLLAVGSTSSNSNNLPVSEQNQLGALLLTGSLWRTAATFYVAGLLLAFTACVYPMIPILSSLIVGQGNSITGKKAFSLSLVYVLAMASVYAVVGILVGLSGYNIQPLFQNPWVLTAFAALFVLLALSMFGLYELRMPAGIQQKLTAMSNRQSGGSWVSVATMGMLSALIVGPCVTAPLVAALAYIANTGDAVLGGVALFAIGIGMGTPLLVIGTTAGKWMPKAGAWMQFTQRIFGIVLLGVAILMLSRFLPINVIMLMSAALAIFAGVYLGALDSTDSNSGGLQRFGKSVGILATVYGVVLMIGAFSGNSSFIAPLKNFGGSSPQATGGSQQTEHLVFRRVKGLDGLNAALADAKKAGQPVMFDFYADWCVSCKEMEAYTFTDPRVKEQLASTLLIQADVTKNDAQDQGLLKAFGLFGPPAILLYDAAGNELTAARVVGYMPAEKFSAHLQAVLRSSS